MQSSNLDNIGIKPSLFTDRVGEFSFCKCSKEKIIFTAISNIKSTIVFLIQRIFAEFPD